MHRCHQDEKDRGHPVDDDREHVLEAVEALQAVGQEDRQQRDHDDSLARPEVAAVDGAAEHGQCQRPALVRLRVAVPGERLRQSRAGRHQHQCHEDQDRDDCLARARQRQQNPAGQPASTGDDPQANRPRPLAGEFAAVADRTAERSRHESNGVRDVGVERPETESQQQRERDERARADDGVDRPGSKSGAEDRDRLERRHRRAPGGKARA